MKGQTVVILCAAGQAGGNVLMNVVRNLRPRIVKQGNIVLLFPPLLRLPFISFFSSMLMSPFFVLFSRSKGVRFRAIMAASVAYGATAKLTKKLVGGVLMVDYGDPEYLRLKSVSLTFLRFLETYVLRPGPVYTCIDPVIGRYLRRFRIVTSLFLPPGGYWKGQSSPPIPVRGRNVVYAGHVGYPPYRIDLLLRAAPIVLRRFPETTFFIVGDGKFVPEARRGVKAAGLEDRIIFPGRVSHEKAREYIAGADVAVQLLDDMCLGTKVIDYFSLKRAVVSCGSFFDSYDEFLKNGENCILTPPDASRIAEALTLLLSSDDLRRQMGEKAFTTLQGYDWDSQASKLLQAIEDAERHPG